MSYCKHENTARDDNIWTCVSCGTVTNERQVYLGEHSNIEYIPKFKKTLGKNEVRSKNYMLFRDTKTRDEVENLAKKACIKYIKQTSKRDLLEKISTLSLEPKDNRTLTELRRVARSKGIKRINSYSKKDLLNKINSI